MKKGLLKITVLVLTILALAGIGSGSLIAEAASKPAKVTGLTAVKQDDDEIDLTWNSVSGASGYQVYRYDSTAKKWVLIKTTSRTHAEAENLSSAKKYKFKVRAYSSSGGTTVYGTKSDTLSAYTEPDEVRKVTATSTTATTVTLSWKKVTRATKYQVYVYDSAKGQYVRKTTVSGTTAVITGLTAGTTYKFKVRAYKLGTDGIKYYGDFSDVCKVKTNAAAGSSTGSSVSSSSTNSSSSASSSTSSSTSSTATTSYIGTAKAKAIAFADAGVKESAVYDLDVEFDWEKGVAVYEVSFDYAGYEYDYEINATTGAIIEKKVERD